MTTFNYKGWIYKCNENLTSCWAWPEGRKGERIRISKKMMMEVTEAKIKEKNK